ncbi:MAG: YbgA family protein [Aestuariibacter sp.]
MDKIKLGTSACVLGQKVRYDGGHKRSAFVDKHVSQHYELMPFCPEVGMGMSVPRPTIHIREINEQLRLVDSKDANIDHTEKNNGFFEQIRGRLATLDGFILAAKSPTCGLERIKVYDAEGKLQHRKGTGMFARLLQAHFPLLPLEEDGRLNDQGLRECFFTKVSAFHDFRQNVLPQKSKHALIQFHSRYKFLVMAYSPQTYQSLGRFVANVDDNDLEDGLLQYLEQLMSVLSKPTNRKKHTNVLMHIQGFFKQQLDKEDKSELTEQIEQYRKGLVPLMAPVTLLNHFRRKYPDEYLESQVYFQPYPMELGLNA